MSRNLAMLIAQALQPKPEEQPIAAPMVPPQPPPIDPSMLYGDAPPVEGQELNPQLQALQQHSGLLNLLYQLRNRTAGQLQDVEQQAGG